MDKTPLRETFGSLLNAGRFTECIEEHGIRYRQAYFRSPSIVLRIAEQEEITPQGASVTCLAFLVDPNNASRWCMFEKAAQVMLGRKIEGSTSLLQLERNLSNHIDLILEQLAQGNEPPFEDFSQFE
jgi:hypothetical protein